MAAKIPPEREAAMIAAYLAGASLAEAAAPFGYSLSTCANALHRNGLSARSTRVPKAHEEAIIKTYLAGSSAKEAVAPFGYSPDVCLKILHRNDVPVRSQQIPPEHEEAIIKAYQDGASAKQAAALFGYSDGTALKVLRRNGITLRSQRIPIEHEEAMIKAYLGGATLEQAAAPFGYSLDTCYAALRRNGFSARSVSEFQRRYAVDESFFDQIDTEEKAYWLGFLTADGSINIKNGALNLALQESDETHLHKFASAIRSQHPVVLRKNGTHLCARITIISLRLVRALERLGVTERKSFTVKPCQEIPDALQAAYWRGLFDGDGSIGYYKTSRSGWRIYLCGSQSTIEGFRTYISHFVSSRATVRPHGKIFLIEYTGSNLPRTVARLLYEGATVYLDRNYELAQKLIAEG